MIKTQTEFNSDIGTSIKYVCISIKGQLVNDQITEINSFQQSCMDSVTRRRRRNSQILKKEQPVTKTEEAQISFRVVTDNIVHSQANGKMLLENVDDLSKIYPS